MPSVWNDTAETGPAALSAVNELRAAHGQASLAVISAEEMATNGGAILRRIRDGESLLLVENGISLARIEPLAVPRRRPYALAAGTFIVPDDFDAPLDEDVFREFEGE